MRILYATGSPASYMAAPRLGTEQINCGPDWLDADIGGYITARNTPLGEYDLGAIAARLPADQQPDAVVCLVDSSWRSTPRNLAAFRCPKVLLVADTHHLNAPLTGMIRYAQQEAFDRVVLYALGQPAITVDDVRESVSMGPDQQENFGIANAIGRNDAREALRQLGAALDGGAAPFFVLGQLRVAAERLSGTRLRPAIDALLRTDLALKGSGGDPRILLERLVVELCGPAPRGSAPLKGAPYAGRAARR